jgi:hypothetical protein
MQVTLSSRSHLGTILTRQRADRRAYRRKVGFRPMTEMGSKTDMTARIREVRFAHHYRSVAIANPATPIDVASERLASLQVNARGSWPSLWVNWGVACRAVKVAAIFEPDNLKAL